MKRHPRHDRCAFAMVATLALFVFLTAMIAVVLRGNANRRRYLRLRQDHVRALHLAESGVQEAMHTLRVGQEAHSLERRIGRGQVLVKVRPAEGRPGFYEIRSTGLARPGEAVCAQKRIIVRVVLPQQAEGGGTGPRLLSWEAE